ncbi:hypothetical protein CGZ80_04825, partial [Rhodopirellula sp. MGV]
MVHACLVRTDRTGQFLEGRCKAKRIVDEAGLLACALYVDLNLVRAAMAKSPGQCLHASACDQTKSTRGEQIPSAAFDLKPVSTKEAGMANRETPVDGLQGKRKQGRKGFDRGMHLVRRLAQPPRLKLDKLSDDAEVYSVSTRRS